MKYIHENKFLQMKSVVIFFCLIFVQYVFMEVFWASTAVQYHSWHETHYGIISSFSPSCTLLVKSQCWSVIHPNSLLTENLVVNPFSFTIPESGIEDLEPAFQDHFARCWMMCIHLLSLCMAHNGVKKWRGGVWGKQINRSEGNRN